MILNFRTSSFLNLSIPFQNDANSFQFDTYDESKPEKTFEWSAGMRHSPKDISWPPKGVALNVYFKPPTSAKIQVCLWSKPCF